MKLTELKKLMRLLRSEGVRSYKHNGLDGVELEFYEHFEARTKDKRLTKEEEKEIENKIEEMTSIMKLDDKSLIDRMFPDTVEDEEGITQ